MLNRALLLLALLTGMTSCAQEQTPAAPPTGDVEARWTLKAGDTLATRMVLETVPQETGSVMETKGLFRVREVGADGVSRGTVEVVRHFMRTTGEPSFSFLYEDGVVKESGGPWEAQRESLATSLKRTVESRLLPTGILVTADANDHRIFANWPLGVQLPGKRVAASESWNGVLRVAHCDALEMEYRFASAGARMKVTGRSTPAAEQAHRIRARVEGTFVPAQGCIAEGRIDIDFSPLGSEQKMSVQFAIERR